MFASKTLTGHLARGGIGLGAFALCGTLLPHHPVLALLTIPIELFALRGCPMCWTIGLFETLGAKVRGRAARDSSSWSAPPPSSPPPARAPS